MIDLQVCKFNGVEIHFIGAPTTGGHRIVTYNYPGSDKQAIEIQGKAPRKFQIVGVIPNSNYYDTRDGIIAALNDNKKHTLIHPTFGEVENIVCVSWSINETISDLGRAEITIDFAIDNATGIPSKAFNVKPVIFKSFDNVLAEIQKTIEDNIDLSLIHEGIDIAKYTIDQARAVAEFGNRIKVSIKSPALFASTFGGIFGEAYEVYKDANQAFNAFSRLFTFGDDLESINPITTKSLGIKINQDLVTIAVKSEALSYAYKTAIDIDYKTSDEIDLVQTAIENQYLSVRDLVQNYDAELYDTIITAIDDLRIKTIDMLDGLAIAAPYVFEIDVTSSTPLSVLLYSYYGNTELFDTIAELNNVKSNAFVSGNIKLISQ